MPIISKSAKVGRKILRIKVRDDIQKEVEQYCKWADIDDISHFYSEVAKKIFEIDKEWQKVKQNFLKVE